MSGWIKTHRAIKHHWIFSDAEKLRAWIIILLTVNFEPKKVNISNTLLECGRGESLLSIDSWVDKFNEKNKGRKWNKSSVRRFLKLLENDSMIVLKSERKTTRLTVCNYERYQDERNANETQTKRKRNANETQMTPTKEREERKELKNDNNNRGKRFSPPTIDEIKTYCIERKNTVDSEKFHDFYSSKNWMIGKNKMKDWKAAVRTWEKHDNSSNRSNLNSHIKKDQDEW